MALIRSEHGFHPSCGDFGVSIRRKTSHFPNGPSMEVEYDEFIDNEHKLHHIVLPWDGRKLSVEDVERLLNMAHVPAYIQDVSAISMVQRCTGNILEEGMVDDHHQDRRLSSFSVVVMSDKDTCDYDALFKD